MLFPILDSKQVYIVKLKEYYYLNLFGKVLIPTGISIDFFNIYTNPFEEHTNITRKKYVIEEKIKCLKLLNKNLYSKELLKLQIELSKLRN